MPTFFVLVAVATALANAAIVAADLARAPFVLANSAEVGVPESWLPLLAALKAAGVLGILVGVVWHPGFAVAAAGGLTLFFVGALLAHVRARVFHNIGFPGAYFALAVLTLGFALADAGWG